MRYGSIDSRVELYTKGVDSGTLKRARAALRSMGGEHDQRASSRHKEVYVYSSRSGARNAVDLLDDHGFNG